MSTVLFAYNWEYENCPLYGVAGCLLFMGCLSIEVNRGTVGTFRIVCYIVSAVELRGVVRWGSTADAIVTNTWGPCIAVVESFPICPSSLSPQVNSFPSSVHTTQCSEPHAMSTTVLLARGPITRFGERQCESSL